MSLGTDGNARIISRLVVKFLFVLVAAIGANETRALADPAVSFDGLLKLITKYDIRTLDGLLGRFRYTPYEVYLQNFTLVHSSRSVQKSSPSRPRVISFGRDAKLVIAFNGDPKHRGYDSLEVMEFDDQSEKFHFREIVFDHANHLPKAPVSLREGRNCFQCHTRSGTKEGEFKPIWNGYPLWPTLYGSLDDFNAYNSARGPVSEALQAFVQESPRLARYHYLKFDKDRPVADLSASPVDGATNNFRAPFRINLTFGVLLSMLNNRRIDRLLKDRSENTPFSDVVTNAQNYYFGTYGSSNKKFYELLGIPVRVAEDLNRRYLESPISNMRRAQMTRLKNELTAGANGTTFSQAFPINHNNEQPPVFQDFSDLFGLSNAVYFSRMTELRHRTEARPAEIRGGGIQGFFSLNKVPAISLEEDEKRPLPPLQGLLKILQDMIRTFRPGATYGPRDFFDGGIGSNTVATQFVAEYFLGIDSRDFSMSSENDLYAAGAMNTGYLPGMPENHNGAPILVYDPDSILRYMADPEHMSVLNRTSN